MEQLTQARLHKLLYYHPETGMFMWRVSRGCARSGMQAGCVFVNKKRKGKGPRLFIKIDRKYYNAGRLAFLYMTGKFPPVDIDHWDGDGLNNCWQNLRAATRSQNQANAKLRADNKTGFKGVTLRKGSRRYQAKIRVNGEHHYLGRFDTPEEAHAVYLTAAKKFFGEFARAT